MNIDSRETFGQEGPGPSRRVLRIERAGYAPVMRNIDGLPLDGSPWTLWTAALAPQSVPATAA